MWQLCIFPVQCVIVKDNRGSIWEASQHFWKKCWKKPPTCSMMLILCSTEQFNCKLLKAKEECVLLKFSKPVNIFTLVSRALYQRIATQHLHTYSVYATHPHTTVKEKDHLHRRVKINVFSLTSIHKTVIIWANLHCWCCQVEQGSLITSVCHASHEKW